jgi:hypothetical protein
MIGCAPLTVSDGLTVIDAGGSMPLLTLSLAVTDGRAPEDVIALPWVGTKEGLSDPPDIRIPWEATLPWVVSFPTHSSSLARDVCFIVSL